MNSDMVRTGHPETLPQINRAEILRYLNLNPNDVKAQALILVCERYGLDPLLKHVVLINGNIYVTRDGLMHVAHDSGKLDGLEVTQLAETQTHFLASASVWRKDMGRPFTFQGRYPKSAQMAKYGPEMAEKVAVCRALRHAFDVALCSREETWEEERETPQAQMQQPSHPSQFSRRRSEPASQDGELERAMTAFAEEAAALGLDVMGDREPGRPSRRKMESLFQTIATFAETSYQVYNPAHWVAATAGLESYVRQTAEEGAVAVSDSAEKAKDADFTPEIVVTGPGHNTALFASDEVPMPTPAPVHDPRGRI